MPLIVRGGGGGGGGGGGLVSWIDHLPPYCGKLPLLRQQSAMRLGMTTSLNTFSALLGLCVGNSPVTGEFPARSPVARSFYVFFDLCLNKLVNKQSWG